MNQPDMKQLEEYTLATIAIRERIMAENPKLPVLTALIMSGDIYAAQQAERFLHEGEITWAQALSACGSYSRVDAALRWQEEGYATRDELLDRWPDLWVGSDPDDTDPRFLEVWKEARDRRTYVVTDQHGLPPGEYLRVYRGQMPGDEVGIAWTLDRLMAQKFANGASLRVHTIGVVLSGTVKRSDILAYLTARNESEVIVAPSRVK